MKLLPVSEYMGTGHTPSLKLRQW